LDDDEAAFWGTSARPSGRYERTVRRRDNAVDLLTPLLSPDERITIVLPDGCSASSRERVTVAVSTERFFVVVWTWRGRCKKTLVADRHDVRARIVTDPEGEDAIRLIGPWGRMTVGGTGWRRSREIVAFLNPEPS